MNCLNEKFHFGETGIIWKITYSDLFKKILIVQISQGFLSFMS